MSENKPSKALFDLEAVFEVDDYMYVYRDDLTDERSEAEVALLVKVLELNSPMRILDLACGFGRHANRLAALGHSVTGVDFMPGFLKIAHQKGEFWLGVMV
jgi:2-polyprenyl-3-methyl-5-hydroxy-6-metoxy-1,4-benzoquinol methylase